MIDELPLFALAAASARGESIVRGAGELRAQGNGPHRNCERSAQSPWRAGHEQRTMASG